MDINLLHTFLEVSKTHHFREAANNLYLTQSAVSARIQLLEKQLNVKLFDRSNKMVKLTAEGDRFLKHAESIISSWQNAKIDLNTDIDLNPQLTIATTTGLWHYLFNDQISSMSSKGALLVNALALPGRNLLEYLKSNLVDLAFVYSPESHPNLNVSYLKELELNLICPKRLPESFSISNTPYIHVDWGENFNLFIAKKLAAHQKRILQTDNALTAQHMLKEFSACAYLPKSILTDQEELHTASSKDAPVFKRKIYACYLESNDNKKNIKRIISDLKN